MHARAYSFGRWILGTVAVLVAVGLGGACGRSDLDDFLHRRGARLRRGHARLRSRQAPAGATPRIAQVRLRLDRSVSGRDAAARLRQLGTALPELPEQRLRLLRPHAPRLRQPSGPVRPAELPGVLRGQPVPAGRRPERVRRQRRAVPALCQPGAGLSGHRLRHPHMQRQQLPGLLHGRSVPDRPRARRLRRAGPAVRELPATGRHVHRANDGRRRVLLEPLCGPQNCPGCCVGDQCLSPGSDPNACGESGQPVRGTARRRAARAWGTAPAACVWPRCGPADRGTARAAARGAVPPRRRPERLRGVRAAVL